MQIINKELLRLYFTWSSNALIGFNPSMSDRQLRDNYPAIKLVADYLLKEINYQPKGIYRGIIMHDQALTELIPHKNMTYLSFSEDLNIARHFADVNGFGAQYGINNRLGKHGYIIPFMPQLKDVLFHHHFIQIFPYIKVWNEMGIDGTDKTLEIQKEVMIRQPQEPFKNIVQLKNILTNEKILRCQGSTAG